MKNVVLLKKDYLAIVKRLRELNKQECENELYDLGKEFLSENPDFYKQLILVNDSEHLGDLLETSARLADRKYKVWLWCNELCEKNPGAKVFGDWDSYLSFFEIYIDQYYQDFDFVRKDAPEVLQGAVRKKIKELHTEIELKKEKYDPSQWDKMPGSIGLTDQFKRESQPERLAFHHTYLKNSLSIRLLETEFLKSKYEPEENEDSDKKKKPEEIRKGEKTQKKTALPKFRELLKDPRKEKEYIEVLKNLNPDILDDEGKYVGGQTRKGVFGLWLYLLRKHQLPQPPSRKKMAAILNARFPDLNLGKEGRAIDYSSGQFSNKANSYKTELITRLEQIHTK